MSFLTKMLAASNPTSFDAALQAAGFAMAGGYTSAGVTVNAETELKLSAVYACDRLISETVASLPALVFERLADGGRKRATNHPLYDVLHRAPNDYQTPVEFFDYLTHCAIMRGNGLARIVAGPRGFADQLIPLNPDHVQIEAAANGALRYRVNEPDRPQEVLGDADVLHVKGMSADGKVGVSVIAYAREALGLALGAERFGARYFKNNARPGGVLEVAKTLSPEAGKKLKASWEAAQGGENQGRVAVLEDGVTFKETSINNKDSQFLETREFQAEDICRWFRVPPHMVGLTSKVTSWGSGIEQLGQGFITYTLMPWLVRWQQAISRDLILAPNKYFVEFATEALLRGDLKARYDAYAIGIDKGWLSPNEVRRTENLNPRPGGDVYAGAGAPMGPAAEAAESDMQASSHYVHLVNLAAGRVVRKEVAALARAAKRGDSGPAWDKAVGEFFADHADFVAQALGITPALAARYVADTRAAVTLAGPDGLLDAETARAGELAELVLTHAAPPASAPARGNQGGYGAGPMINVNLPPVSVYPDFHVEQPAPTVVNQINPTPVTVENRIEAAAQPAPVVQVTVEPTPVRVENNVTAEAPQVVVNTPRLKSQRTSVYRKGDEMSGTVSSFEYED